MQAKLTLRRHLLVGLAITMMVSSALLSYFLVHRNDRNIALLRQEQQEMDETIRSLWDNAGRMEHNADAAVIVSLLAKNDTAQASSLKQYYLARTHMTDATASLTAMLKAMDEERERTINLINDTYIRRTSVENEATQREQDNMLYANIAFFLQLTGLVLVVLTRDTPDA